MRIKFFIVVVVFGCLFSEVGVVNAQQQVYFDHLTVEKGLSQNSVLTIAQDRDGFMWFGTQYGLNRYDGFRFKIYQKGNAPSNITANEIKFLFNDHQKNLWIGTSSGLNKYIPETNSFKKIFSIPGKPTSLSNNGIMCMYQDRKHNIWIGTANGLNKMDQKSPNVFKHFFKSQGGLSSSEIRSICEDSSGRIWVGTTKGLTILEEKNGKLVFKNYFTSAKRGSIPDNYITCITTDKQNRIWLGTQNGGFCSYDSKNDYFTTFNSSNGASDHIRKIVPDNFGKLWIGTLEGLLTLDLKTKQLTTIKHDPENKKSLSQNSIYGLFIDNNNSVWAGTYFGGVNVAYPTTTIFNHEQSSLMHSSLSDNVISSIVNDRGGKNLWIGTEGGGLNYFDQATKKYTWFKNSKGNNTSLGSNLIKALLQDKDGNLWIGTHGGGLNQLAKGSTTFKHFLNSYDEQMVTPLEVPALAEDGEGIIWVGTQNGLYKSNSQKTAFSRSPIITAKRTLNEMSIKCIFKDSRDAIWLGSFEDLLYKVKGSSTFIDVFEQLKSPVPEIKYINTISEDSKKRIWVGTYYGGLYCYFPDSQKIEVFTEANGLPSNNVLGILEDNAQHLWISTSNGLSMYNPVTKKFKNYNTSDGLANNTFNRNAQLKTATGELFFGGYNGLISFYPNNIQSNNLSSKVVLTDLKIANQTIEVNDSSQLLTSALRFNTQLELAHDQNTFTLEFALLNYIKSSKNRYAYKLEGFEKNYNYVNTPSASYTNLPIGSYTFVVNGINNDGVESGNVQKIKIIVKPPFYRTWWAYAFYCAIFAGILFILIRYLIIKAVFKKEKEVNEHKLEFFTNISHEIRTPLTLIVGPLEHLLDAAKENPILLNELLPIKNNADRLMNLVTELLDFRKAESGKMKLQVSPGNIVKFCREIFIAFQNMAIAKQITYTFNSPDETIELYFDKVQLEKVLFNLLANAFKFTPDRGNITLVIEEKNDEIIVNVYDNGDGIPLAQQAGLFTDFYQANSNTSIGTGLGLSFSKRIVELHHGSLSFKSTPAGHDGYGETVFSIRLKTGKQHFSPSDFIADYVYYDDAINYTPIENIQLPEPTLQFSTKETQKSTLLLVEDNEEVRAFVKNSLINVYDIYESENGLAGLETAIELIPDLIISDVMMPVMDGLELCRRIKTDERTSHIPVILLTARSAYIHQVNGLENGADSYIMKPFSLKLLLLQIKNILKAKEVIRQKFGQVITLEPTNLIVNSTELNFLNKIISIIEEHIDDPNLDVPFLSAEIGMSQPILYKKIRAMTDLSVNDFIKSHRIKRAAQLLKQNAGNITEIAYAVGFSDRKYFSIEFKKIFGVTPSDYIKENEI